jgi:hypothetical protein
MNKFGQLNKHEISASILVENAIKKGNILIAYDALNRKMTSVGPYQTAVPCDKNFAIFGAYDREYKTAEEAADFFVAKVGSTRAREAAKKFKNN